MVDSSAATKYTVLGYILFGAMSLYFLEKDTPQPLDYTTAVYMTAVTLTTVGNSVNTKHLVDISN
jgi:hypothetical protein